jgi:hypothetical protein
MPNWCENRLSITTDNPKLISLFHEIEKAYRLGQELFLFETLVPLTDDVSVENNNYIDFCYSQWGTKWDVNVGSGEVACSLTSKNSDEWTIYISLDTAWSPPCNFVDGLAKKYACKKEDQHVGEVDQNYLFNAELFYIEFGMDFCGVFIHDGQHISYQDYSVSESIRDPNIDFLEIIESLGYELDVVKSYYVSEDEDADNEF